jgi:hypothetical protein
MGTEGHDSALTSLSAASRRLGISRRRLKQAVKRGELAAFRPGSRTCYVIWPDVLRWLREQRVDLTDHAHARVAEIMERQSTRPRPYKGHAVAKQVDEKVGR